MNLAPNDPRHGTQNAYVNHKCRCDACKASNQEYYKNGPGKAALDSSRAKRKAERLADLDGMVSVSALSKATGMHKSLVSRRIKNGQIANVTRVRGRNYIKEAAAQEMIDAHRRYHELWNGGVA